MKKVALICISLILVMILAACGAKGDKVPVGTYKVSQSSGAMDMYKSFATLEVKEDGTATLNTLDSTEVKFNENRGIVTFDKAKAKYSVDGNKITFIWDDGSKWVFEKK